MGADDFCPNCGSKLRSNAPSAHCPRCLLRLGLESELWSDPNGDVDTNGSVEARSELGPLADCYPCEACGSSQSSGMLGTHDRLIGPFPRIQLRGAAEDTGVILAGSSEVPDLCDHPGRYHLAGEVARGGMGAVLIGRDVDLGRDLAIKVILEEHRDRPEVVRRFVEEAQIGGQLQHPGIVPVHELGRFPDGRLYIAMKLVRGRTLAELLGARNGLGDDRPRFLSIFESVCQTIAYAHSRSVVHRDLKPSNVMVGTFGEVQVMDWGLAKVLNSGGIAEMEWSGLVRDGAIAVPADRAGADPWGSRDGSVLGTPAYMAPEQARGAVDLVDERADVFALGSILCEILSGQPAYAGRESAEMYRMAEARSYAPCLTGSTAAAPMPN